MTRPISRRRDLFNFCDPDESGNISKEEFQASSPRSRSAWGSDFRTQSDVKRIDSTETLIKTSTLVIEQRACLSHSTGTFPAVALLRQLPRSSPSEKATQET